MPNSNSNNYNSRQQEERSPELLVEDLKELTIFINHPAWQEMVKLVHQSRTDAIDAFINLPVKDLGTFLEREQLIGEARAYGTVLKPIVERFEELKQQTEQLTQQ